MKDERVVQIAASMGEVYGLTESNKLVYFDKSVASFVLKCGPDILSMDKANVLKKIEPNLVSENFGKYGEPGAVKLVARPRNGMVNPVNISIALIALALLLYWFVK